MRARRSSGTLPKPAKLDRAVLAAGGNAGPALNQETGFAGVLTSAGVQRVLHYDIQAKIGQGGMGVVYKALDQKLNRLVALKFLPPQIDLSNVDLQRFLQEANALSALNHPHIATIYAVETAGEQQFLVLEYLPGGTLKAKLQQTCSSGAALSIDDVLKYARQTAEGLAHAHSRGIIHRDVKTSNLMLTQEGDVKVTDFGVAKLSGSSLATNPGSLMGTIAYMSPEQALGMDVDTRSDVFSFGVSLFELITGRLPFEAPNDAALITKVASARVPELKDFRSDVPAHLDLIVQRALKKRVEERYQKMDDLLADLQAPALPNLLHTQTRPRISIKKPVGISPNRGFRIAGAALLLIAAVLAGVLFPSFWQRLFGRYELPPVKQLAVLRLRNVTGGQLNQELCDGLTEVITNKLGQLEQFQGSLSVVAPSEVLEQNVTGPRAARKTLGATLVLDGSLQRIRDRLIITLSLVDTGKQTILVARDVETTIEKLPELQNSLVEKVAEMLKVQVKPETRVALVAGLPADAGAYRLYLQGLGYLKRYDRVEELDKAIDLFEQALSHDPSYALAYAGKAEAYLRKYRATKELLLIGRAQESGQRAVELDNTLAPVHYSVGLIYATQGKYQQAIESLQKSIQIGPDPNAYRELGNAYDALNRPQEAETTYKAAIEMHPTYWAGYRDFAVFLQNHGRFTEALPLFQKVVQLTPDNYAGFANLGGLYLRLGMIPQAIEYFERAISIKPTMASYYNLGTTAYLEHRYADAIEMYKKAIQLGPTEARPWAALADAYRWVPQSADQVRDTYAHAIELIEKELIVNPSDGRNRARIASWRVVTDKKMALKEIMEALRLSPHDNFVQARAAAVYEQSGRRKEALAAVKSALELGFSVDEIQKWPALARLVHDPRYAAFVEKKPKKGPTVPLINK